MTGAPAGRFGWHGQTSNLRDFVLGACANELGLQTPGHFQVRDPMQPDYFSRDPDMDERQVAQLVSFVASLPPPPAEVPKDAEHLAAIRRGAMIFRSTRCSMCHVPDVGPARGIYSDLLTHDMGENLADPRSIPTAIHLETPDVPLPEDAPSTEPYSSHTARIWRTPPLWGVRFTAPYLHDGRAATMEEAILLHGGQAGTSLKLYKRLSRKDKQHLLAFVHSLGAPPNDVGADASHDGGAHAHLQETDMADSDAQRPGLQFPKAGVTDGGPQRR
jgi:CxxC motif-containing protein (DUF1111 family)